MNELIRVNQAGVSDFHHLKTSFLFALQRLHSSLYSNLKAISDIVDVVELLADPVERHRH